MSEWIPFRRCMQRYCEPFFAAIEVWRNYESIELLSNRICMIEAAYDILNKYSQNEDTYFFDLQYDNISVSLIPETFPTAGLNYIIGGDTQARLCAKKLVPENLFNRVGVFFQTNLLKAMAGYSDSYMVTANIASRKSILLSIEKLFRLPEEAGFARFVFRLCNSTENTSILQVYKGQPLSESGKAFVQCLMDSRNNTSSPKVLRAKRTLTQTKRESEKKARKNGKKSEISSEDCVWTTDHSSVGNRVAAYFHAPHLTGGQQLYYGKVTKYSPNAQWYHIVWEDGDEQDYDDFELQAGMALFEENYGWLTEHEEIGTPVATYQWNKHGNKKKEIIIRGKVCKVSLSLADKEFQSKYMVDWETGDTAILSSEEFEQAVVLLKQSHELLKEHTNTNTTNMKDASVTAAANQSEEGAKEAEEVVEEEEEILWTETHSSVGTSVAAYFNHLDEQQQPIQKLFFGKVAKYAPESKPNENDQLYHIVWEDGDEQDYDENEYVAATALFNSVYQI